MYDPLIVFHGTTEAAIPSIMSGGFEVGGGGKVPIRTGTLLGKGVYTSLNATVPGGYVAGGGGGTVKKLIMAVAVEGKRGGASPDAAMRAASGSLRNASDDNTVVFKSGEQLHPKWVVHYREGSVTWVAHYFLILLWREVRWKCAPYLTHRGPHASWASRVKIAPGLRCAIIRAVTCIYKVMKVLATN